MCQNQHLGPEVGEREKVLENEVARFVENGGNAVDDFI